MVEARGRPAVYTIPVHRAFADALVGGLLAKFGCDRLTLARGLVIVSNNRAARAIGDAFVRRAEQGLLLPRLVAIGDVGSEDMPGALFDTGDAPLPPAVDPLRRQLLLARMLQDQDGLDGAEAMRLAADLARVLDDLQAEQVAPSRLAELELGGLSEHWQKSLTRLEILWRRWPERLRALGVIDLAERRNRLLAQTADQWREAPPPGFVAAVGITSAVPAIANLLRIVARLPNGLVVFPGLDLSSPQEEWDAIRGGEEARPIESHPQFQLALLLDRMQVARSDVARWRWGDGRPRQAVRARAVSNAFAPARFTAKWFTLNPTERKLKAVKLAEFAGPADEAQGIAIALREVLETPERTAALVTADRALAARVVQHLKRWGIAADDSAGQPLSATPVGALVQSVATLIAEDFAPIPLLSVLKHPLVQAGEGRLAWLDGVRKLDAALRGPRPAPGIAGVSAFLLDGDAREQRVRGKARPFWREATALLEPLTVEASTLPQQVELVRVGVTRLAGEAAWAGPAGRAAATLLEDLARYGAEGPQTLSRDGLPRLLRDLLAGVAVRPPQGGHNRIAIRGLIEARLQAADLVIVGGLNEGSWPSEPAPDPWLAPRIRVELGLGATERRIGLAAHDLAGALGAAEVLLTRAKRSEGAPTLESRFLLRLKAMLGAKWVEEAQKHSLVELAQQIDQTRPVPPAARPAPRPPVALRPKTISVTDVDRLKADPFSFYAKAMLRLQPLAALDEEPGPAWRGSAVHAVLDQWAREDNGQPEELRQRVAELLVGPSIHPLLRALWQPRLNEAIDWVAEQLASDRAKGRAVLATERDGRTEFAGVTIQGRADRIDRLPDGGLAIVDYKTGSPPKPKAVAEGYAMQLGLLGLIAEAGGFAAITGRADAFEYWSLAKDNGTFGKRSQPNKDSTAEDFLEAAARQFEGAAARWLTGDEPFTAELVPDYAPYATYHQLMRREEWYGR